MPEMRFHVLWPDGSKGVCYSPSLVVEDYLRPGSAYPLAEFVERSRKALHVASARVEEKYGFPCARALRQIGEIERRAALFAGTDAEVIVLAFDRDCAVMQPFPLSKELPG